MLDTASSMKPDLTLVWLHVTGNIFWIGAIAAVAVVLLAKSGDAKLRGELATKIYLHAAVPAFLMSFAAGGLRFAMDASLYLKQPWMHGKLTMALVVIALHHVIGARAKKLARGQVDGPGPTRVLLAVLALCAVAATYFAVTKTPSPGAGAPQGPGAGVPQGPGAGAPQGPGAGAPHERSAPPAGDGANL